MAFASGTPVQSQPDMARFIHNADICEHLAGEWSSENTKSENRTIELNMNKHCGLAKRLQKSLLVKYKEDASAADILNKYESVNYFKLH